MNKRKQYLIDKKYQLGQTFSLMKFISLILAIILSLIVFNAVINNNKLKNITNDNTDIIKKLEDTMIIHDQIVEAVLTWVQKPEKKPQTDAIKEVAITHYKELKSSKSNIQIIKQNVSSIDETIKLNRYLIIAIIVIVILQGVLFYFIMIRKTHKIAGPVYVMSNYMNEIIDGKYPSIRALREGDELNEFYELFGKMIDILKERDSM